MRRKLRLNSAFCFVAAFALSLPVAGGSLHYVSPTGVCESTLTIGTGSGTPGSAGNPVSVRLTNNQVIRGVQVDVTDSTGLLTATGCTSLVAGLTCSFNDTGAAVRVLFFSFSAATIPIGTDVEIFRLLYSVDAATPVGTVPLVPQGLLISDPLNEACGATGVTGSFEVLAPPCQTDADCDDTNPCTDDSCVPETGCVNANNTAACNDGDACTIEDTCGGGICAGVTPVDCNDANPCTDDSCDPKTGCTYGDNTNTCEDGNACTTGDICGGGTCAGATPVDCNDDNTCTDDSCDSDTGCTYSDNTNPCDDGNVCTTGDSCGGGTCHGGSGPNCNDNNPCTTDTCELASGCVNTNNTNPCDDGNACTNGDACGNGTCNGGAPRVCNDGNACTDNACDPATGCVYPNNTNPCDDGNACTNGDACGNGTCSGGAPRDCNDGNACTNDGCAPTTGCTHNFNTSPCNDGNACTVGDTCGNGTCHGGAPPNCDDGNVCTDDSCSPGSGCVHTNNTAPCSDGNACTTGDACLGGMCRGSATLDCDDGDSCTIDSCEAAVGCKHVDDPSCTENQPPDCGAAFARPSKLWPPNSRFVPVSILRLTDPDGDQVTATVTGVRQDEPIGGHGDDHEGDSRSLPGGNNKNHGDRDRNHDGDDDRGDHGNHGENSCPDARGIGTTTALVRAERSGQGNGRVYHVAFTASDGHGGTCTGEVLVCVPHDRGHRHGCVDEGPLFDSTGPCTGR